MSFSQLPTEIVEMVLGHAVPRHWNVCAGTRTVLSLRLVCRQFNSLLSRLLFQNLDMPPFDGHGDDIGLSLQTAAWLLMTKAHLGRRHDTVLMNMLWLTTLLMALCKMERQEAWDMGQVMRGAAETLVANMTRDDFRWAIYYKPSCRPLPAAPSPAERKPASYLHALKERGGLAVAAFLGDVPLVQTLLQDGDDPKQKHKEYGYPLYAAACGGQTETIRLLLAAGAHPTDSSGALGTPRKAAMRLGHDAAVQLLQEAEAEEAEETEEAEEAEAEAEAKAKTHASGDDDGDKGSRDTSHA